MTKKEIQLIKETISTMLENTDLSVEDTEYTKREADISATAKADVLIWLLVRAGHADELPPEWHAEEFSK